jgi:hypothetical protein
MRILITQRKLVHWGGSEMFTIELVKALRQRDHEVVVFCPQPGDLAKVIYPCGGAVKSRLDDIPWQPDIIHGQHHLQAAAALSYFADVPAIYYCHGWEPWVEKVPLHPRIRNYVMMCEWLVAPTAAALDIPRDRITTIPNFVNTKRFSEVRTPPDRPRRALLFGKGGFTADERLRLERACSEAGMSLDKIGYQYGNPQERPEAFLQEYDLVFAIGRCAMEAIACGCAVIPIIPKQGGELVTPENFDAWIFSNFSPVYGNSAVQIHAEWLQRELSKYSRDSVGKVTARLRAEHDLSGGVDKIEEIYLRSIDDYRANKSDPTREFAPYLERLSLEVDDMWEESRRAEQHRRKIKELERQLLSIRSSVAWKLYRPFRFIGSLFSQRTQNDGH